MGIEFLGLKILCFEGTVIMEAKEVEGKWCFRVGLSHATLLCPVGCITSYSVTRALVLWVRGPSTVYLSSLLRVSRGQNHSISGAAFLLQALEKNLLPAPQDAGRSSAPPSFNTGAWFLLAVSW